MRTALLGRIVILIIELVVVSGGVSLFAQQRSSAQQDRVAIERLHQQDVEATLSDKANVLARLWDRDGRGPHALAVRSCAYRFSFCATFARPSVRRLSPSPSRGGRCRSVLG
jgi:hypothetical protein